MKQNLIFLAEKLGLLACTIFVTSVFGRLLHLELDRKYSDASLHYMFIIVFFTCILFLIFAAFYLAHEIAVRDYKIKKHL